MILTGSQIAHEVALGHITIDPFYKNHVNPNSYNYTLGPRLCRFTDEIIDAKKPTHCTEFIIPDSGYVLEPGILYLGHTNETIGSERFVTSLIGRSSVGRLGMFLQITADLGNLGRAHAWTLEIKVVQPLRVYPHMKIGQVSFWQPTGKVAQLKDNSYTLYSTPAPQYRFHKVGAR